MHSLRLHHISKRLYDALLSKSKAYGWSLEETTKYLLRKQMEKILKERKLVYGV